MSQQIDANTGLPYVIKRPTESKTYTVDMAQIMPSDVEVASVVSVSIAAEGLVSPPVATLAEISHAFSTSQVSIKLDAGDDGENYEVSIKVAENGGSGDTHADDFMVKVRKAGNL